jgi:uncharacterized iron-regulated protein
MAGGERMRLDAARAARILALLPALMAALPATGVERSVAATPESLAAAMAAQRSVLLGEVHDNAAQHALRLAALRLRLAAGDRPALAFEQFDRERQAEIDRVRLEQPRNVEAIVALGAPNWQWAYYRPFVQLALEHDLPIVAANLSRGDAMKVASGGWSALFDTATQKALALDRLADDFVASHQQAVAQGHCNLLPADVLPAMARAQAARDIVLAASLRPYLARGVVLLAGNGHVRNDLGVPVWLTPAERSSVVTIGLLESDAHPEPAVDVDAAATAAGTGGRPTQRFDIVVATTAAERPDPCAALRKRLAPNEPR